MTDQRFGPIHTAPDAERALKDLSKGLFAVVAVATIAIGVLFFTDEPRAREAIYDMLFYVIYAIFLPRSKSRALAIVVLVHAIANIALGIAEGHFPWIAIILTLMGARAIQATFAWHKHTVTTLQWRNVISIPIYSVCLGAATGVLAAVVAGVVGASEQLVGEIGTLTMLAVATAGFAGFLPLTGQRPFAAPLGVSVQPRSIVPHVVISLMVLGLTGCLAVLGVAMSMVETDAPAPFLPPTPPVAPE